MTIRQKMQKRSFRRPAGFCSIVAKTRARARARARTKYKVQNAKPKPKSKPKQKTGSDNNGRSDDE